MSEIREDFDEKEFLERVEKAAEEGARKGYRASIGTELVKTIFTKIVIPALAILAVMMFILPKASFTGFSGLFNVEEPVEDHDMTFENHGILGYKAADFADRILSDRTKLKKIEVLSYKVSDAITYTNAGLFKLEVFSKTQVITYHATAVYTVDMSDFSAKSIVVDNDNKRVMLVIPHARLDMIALNPEDMEIGSVEKGMLAFGDLKLTAEQQKRLEQGALEKMKLKLLDDDIQNEADRFAKQVIWELYQPVTSNVAPGYTLEIVLS